MFFNFNNYYINYTYFKNFYYLKDYLNNQSNFTNCEKFDEFKDILIKLFKKDIKNKNANEVIKKMDYYDINKELIESIDDKYFFFIF